MTGPVVPAVPAFDHIFVVIMENHSSTQIIGSADAPYINSLAARYGLAANYMAVAHPSLPNYLALTGGSTFGLTTDCADCFQNAPNIAVDRLVPAGRQHQDRPRAVRQRRALHPASRGPG
jgi:phosphatidylinositol-3-phosphatase